MKSKSGVHAPIRTCLVCGIKKPKGRLQRLALNGLTALVVVDFKKQRPGRGAYACPHCLPRLTFNKRVQKAFRSKAKGLARQ